MADQVNEFRVNESFTEKVLGITVFNGKVVIAREDGVFMRGDDDVFRRVDLGFAEKTIPQSIYSDIERIETFISESNEILAEMGRIEDGMKGGGNVDT